MKKKYKVIFLCKKNDTQVSGFAFVEKAPTLKKKFLKEKSFQLICADKIFKTVGGNIFKTNQSRDIWTFGDFTFQKLVLSNKIINKIRTTKNLENSTHCFRENYLANLFVKFLQDRIKPWKVGVLRGSTGYLFF